MGFVPSALRLVTSAAVTADLSSGEARPGRRGLERLGEDPRVQQRVAQGRGGESSALPRARRILSSRRRSVPREDGVEGPSRRFGLVGIGTLEGRDGEASAQTGEMAPEGRVDLRLGLVAQTEDRGTDAALRRLAKRRRPRREVGEAPGLVERRRCDGPHPHRDLGEHPEGALGPEEELSQVGARRARRRAAENEFAHGGRDAEGVHEVVEATVATGCLTARPRRGEAADRRVQEALREVPERVAARGEQLLGLGAGRAGAEGRDERGLVEREESGGPREIERDHSAVRAGRGIHAADDRRAAAEGYDRDIVRVAGAEDVEDLGMGCGGDHGVGSGLRAGRATREQIGRALAAEVEGADGVVARGVVGADDGAQGFEVGFLEAARGQLRASEAGHGMRFAGQQRRDEGLRGGRESRGLGSPGVPVGAGAGRGDRRQ